MSSPARAFFTSPDGQEVLKTITGMIDSEHAKAEDNPERALAHTQRAKGIREVLSLLQSFTAELNKRPTREELEELIIKA